MTKEKETSKFIAIQFKEQDIEKIKDLQAMSSALLGSSSSRREVVMQAVETHHNKIFDVAVSESGKSILDRVLKDSVHRREISGRGLDHYGMFITVPCDESLSHDDQLESDDHAYHTYSEAMRQVGILKELLSLNETIPSFGIDRVASTRKQLADTYMVAGRHVKSATGKAEYFRLALTLYAKDTCHSPELRQAMEEAVQIFRDMI